MIRYFVKLLLKFYDLAGARLFLLLGLMIGAVFFEGLGIGFILPLLEGVNSESRITGFIRKVFGSIGLEYNIKTILIAVVLLAFLRSLFLITQSWYSSKIQAGLLFRLRKDISEKIFGLEYLAFVKKSTGYINNALTAETSRVVSSFATTSEIIVSSLFAFMYIGIPLILNPGLLLILGIIGLLLFPCMKKINTMTKRNSQIFSKSAAGLQGMLIQALNYFKYLKATGEQEKVLTHVHNEAESLARTQERQGLLAALSRYGFEPFVVVIVAVVIFYYVHIKGANILEHLLFLYLLVRAMNNIISMQSLLRKLMSCWGGVDVIESLEKSLAESEEKDNAADDFDRNLFDKPVLLNNVSFKYDDGKNVLNDVSLKIEKNSAVAFVGDSGAGKSTIVNIVIGLLSESSGSISIGDIDYDKMNKTQFRKCIGYITQENVIFNDSILNNITLWDENSDMEKVRKAAEKAMISEFIESLPDKYNAMLGEAGINISGGQRQRLCIARELYKDAKIIVFDEATSALDTKTEKEIQKNIDELKGEKTIILIAHRLSTVKNCDRIFVLKDGRIVEEGSYNELLSANGEFKRMIDMQAV